MLNTDRPTVPAYEAAHAGIAFAPLAGGGWLTLTGRDRLAFLQRLSTNDLRDLAPGQGRPTVLCSGTGRVMALLQVYVDAETVYVRTEDGQAAGVTRYLNKLIFWNDELQVADTSQQVAQWGLYGPQATAGLARLGEANALADLPPYGWLSTTVAGQAVTIQRGGSLTAAGWHVVAPVSSAAILTARLAELAPQLTAEECEQLRVEAGIPAWGHELNDQVTPLEAGLGPAVSFNKGCYTGQEVIARQHNYDKVTRLLSGLLLPAASGAELNSAPVRAAGGGRPGFVGTVVRSPALGQMIALAVVPRAAAEAGNEVSVGPAGNEVTAVVSSLPFGERRAPAGD